MCFCRTDFANFDAIKRYFHRGADLWRIKSMFRYNHLGQVDPSLEALHAVFYRLDVNRDGAITPADLRTALRGLPFEGLEAEALLAEVRQVSPP